MIFLILFAILGCFRTYQSPHERIQKDCCSRRL